jgi:transmembrane sensor
MENARTTEATAAAWFAKRDSGMWEPQDQAEFDAWLGSSLAHRLAFIRVETVWKQAQRLKALRASPRDGQVPPVGEWQFSPFFESKLAPGASPMHKRFAVGILGTWARGVAAGLFLAVVVAGSWYMISSRSLTYRTAVGGTETVPLPDGSVVTLNTNTEIRVALTRTARTVSLEGEAFFEVAKDPVRPFVVDVGNERVTAVGTKFSVRREGESVRVAVTEGHVLMETKASAAQPLAHLAPGDVASADAGGVLVRQKSIAQVEAEDLTWRQGYITFRDAPLGDVVKELNRYNVRKIKVSDPSVAAIRIGGKFRVANVDAFLRLIQQGAPVRASEQGDDVVLQHD